jgi:hypothetical protein
MPMPRGAVAPGAGVRSVVESSGAVLARSKL